MQKMLGLSFFFLLLFHQGNAKNTISYDEVESVNGCSQDLDTNLFILKKISIDQYQNMDEVNSTVLTVMANERNNRNLALQKVISKSLLYLIGIELFLIIIPIIYVGYRNKITANRKLENLQKETDPKNYSINELLMEKDKLLIERDWLLTEVQHRVKNNLQIITSLLNSQSAFLKNESALYAIRESKNRIEAISLIYQKLYDSNNISVVNMPNYIVELINSIVETYNTDDGSIRFEQVIEPIGLDIVWATPIGLILNEGITNAIKYAFPGGQGVISVRLYTIIKGMLILEVNDNGVGFSDQYLNKAEDSMGMEMIKALSKQLGGTFKIESGRGLQITVMFKYPLPSKII